MRPDTELRTPRARPEPELDVEQDVDLGRLRQALAARWWLPLLGLVLGAALGYAIARGGADVYRAEALVYLGQPLSLAGGSPVQSLATNPSIVREIVTSEAALKQAARAGNLRVGNLRGNVTTQPISGARGLVRAGQTPLIEISVKGQGLRKVERAANSLAQRVVDAPGISGYVDDKIRTFETRRKTQEEALASAERRLAINRRAVETARDLAPIDALVLVGELDNSEQRRAQIIDERSTTDQLLSLAKNVERARVVERAVAFKTTARSVRNSMLAAGVIGLILGIAAALAWESLAARLRRRPSTA